MTLFSILIATLMGVVAISMTLCTARLLMGPSIPDRAMAFDTLMLRCSIGCPLCGDY
jgi:multisubunit Na+/H+ antiporter MnhF subunit